MGLTVVLELEGGESIATLEDPSNALHRLLPSDAALYPSLASIDWYGDTVFNRLQAERFLAEWERLAASAGPLSDEERRLVDGVHSLAERLAHELHVYLRFVGD